MRKINNLFVTYNVYYLSISYLTLSVNHFLFKIRISLIILSKKDSLFQIKEAQLIINENYLINSSELIQFYHYFLKNITLIVKIKRKNQLIYF